MKKALKILLPISLIFTIVFSFFSFNASAAGAIIAFSSSSVTVGNNVTVSITLDAGEAIYAVECTVNYDTNVLKYLSGNAVGTASALKIAESPLGETRVTYTLTFTAIAAGSCAISVSDAYYSGGSVDKPLTGASATLTVKNPALSSNADLKSLSVSQGKLSPRFSANRTSYTVSVANSVTSCSVYASVSDSSASFTISGSNKLQIGDNTRVVTVTAPSGATKSYTIVINRSATEEVKPVEPEEPQETPTNPLETTVDGAGYTVATDISSVTLFKGFELKDAEFNGTKVSVATDKENKYTIYYLAPAEGGDLVPYTYDEKEKVFTKLLYFSQNDFTYIFANLPKDKTLPENFYKTNANIGGIDVACFADDTNETADFFYVYCFSDGRYGMYRYDTRENVMQRFPELKLISKETVANEENSDKSNNIVSNFKALSNNAKTVVISILAAIVFAVALIVLLVIKLINKNDFESDDDFDVDGDFDNIVIDEEISEDENLLDKTDEKVDITEETQETEE